MSRLPELVLAETASLTPEQQAYRLAFGHHLNWALPLEVWLDHRYSVLPGERRKPVAVNGPERWYGFNQVVKRGVNPRSKRRVVVVSGGSMSKLRNRRR